MSRRHDCLGLPQAPLGDVEVAPLGGDQALEPRQMRDQHRRHVRLAHRLEREAAELRLGRVDGAAGEERLRVSQPRERHREMAGGSRDGPLELVRRPLGVSRGQEDQPEVERAERLEVRLAVVLVHLDLGVRGRERLVMAAEAGERVGAGRVDVALERRSGGPSGPPVLRELQHAGELPAARGDRRQVGGRQGDEVGPADPAREGDGAFSRLLDVVETVLADGGGDPNHVELDCEHQVVIGLLLVRTSAMSDGTRAGSPTIASPHATPARASTRTSGTSARPSSMISRARRYAASDSRG